MIFEHKFDREGYTRSKDIETLKSNPYLRENEIVKIRNSINYYKITKEITDISLDNGLYALQVFVEDNLLKTKDKTIIGSINELYKTKAERVGNEPELNSGSSTKLETPRKIQLSGDVVGEEYFDGTKDININIEVLNDSHIHDSRYHTKEEIDEKLKNINDGSSIQYNELNNKINDLDININNKIDLKTEEINQTISSEVIKINNNIDLIEKEINQTISSEISKINNNIDLIEKEINENINVEIDNINNRIDTEIDNINNSISDINKEINENINVEIDKINQTIEDKFESGIYPGITVGSSDKLTTPRNIKLIGDVNGNFNFDGSKNIEFEVSVNNNSHNHDNSTIDNLDGNKINKLTGYSKADSDSLILPTDNLITALGKLSKTLELKQYSNDNNLNTISKNIVGAINELFKTLDFSKYIFSVNSEGYLELEYPGDIAPNFTIEDGNLYYNFDI